MSSPRVGVTGAEETVRPLLDSTLGLGVWALHLLIIYPVTATACQLGLRDATRGGRSTFVAVMVIVTVLALAIVALHALRRHRLFGTMPERQFRIALTIGCDALAGVAIAWQLFALLLVPLCA